MLPKKLQMLAAMVIPGQVANQLTVNDANRYACVMA